MQNSVDGTDDFEFGGRIMSSFKLLRISCRIVGIILCAFILISRIADWEMGVWIGWVFLIIDFFVIAIKNRCPFCHKSLRIAPIKGEEFCPYCGCGIK